MKETCLNCKRYTDNGGQCYGDYKFHSTPCLAYIKNELGERLHKAFRLQVPAGYPVKEGDKYEAIDLDLIVVRIKDITWNMREMCIVVIAECKCWSEQYNKAIAQEEQKIKLTVIKGQKS